MKIGTSKGHLQEAIIMAEKIVGKKESLPILSCVLFEAEKGLVIRATNLESGIEIRVPGEVTERGVVAVPASVLSQTIRSIGGDTVSCSTDEGNLLIDARGTKTVIKAVPHDEFPVLPESSKRGGIEVPREKLLKSIQSVSYAASPSMIRADLGSISIAVRDNTLTSAATDSFRLAEKVITGVQTASESDLLIPLRHALELAHILEHITSDTVLLSVEDAQLAVEGDGVRFVTRIVDATFPNYREIIPKQFATEATILKSDFMEMLKKARVFAGNDQHVGLHLYPKKKIFTAMARSANVGEMSDEIDAALTGDDIDINFHIAYLSECLPSIESDSVSLQFAGPGRPLVMKGTADHSFMYLVMPLNR